MEVYVKCLLTIFIGRGGGNVPLRNHIGKMEEDEINGLLAKHMH
jgi:hypothetical protein